MSYLVGTLNHTLNDIRSGPTSALFFIWRNGGPTLEIDFDSNNQPTSITLVNNIVTASPTVTRDFELDDGSMVSDGLTINQTLVGNILTHPNLVWTCVARMIQGPTQANPTQTSPTTPGNYAVTLTISVVNKNSIECLSMASSADPLLTKEYFGNWEVNSGALRAIKFVNVPSNSLLTLSDQTLVSVDGTMTTFYADYDVISVESTNHAFFWVAKNNRSNAERIMDWELDPNDVPNNIPCLPSCESGFICDTSTGICEPSPVPIPPVPPLPPSEGSGLPWWGWVLIIIGVLLFIGIIIGLVVWNNSRSKTTGEITIQPVDSDETVGFEDSDAVSLDLITGDE